MVSLPRNNELMLAMRQLMGQVAQGLRLGAQISNMGQGSAMQVLGILPAAF